MAAYTTVEELARVLTLRQYTVAQGTAMQRVLDTAAGEIDSELGTTYLGGTIGTPALVAQVNLERAVEHWQQQESPFGVLGLGEAVPTMTAKDTWDRHAFKLAPLKQTWGLA